MNPNHCQKMTKYGIIHPTLENLSYPPHLPKPNNAIVSFAACTDVQYLNSMEIEIEPVCCPK